VWTARLRRSITRPAADPIDQQEGADEKWEYAVQCITNGMRMSVNGNKYRDAEQGGEQAHDRTWSGYRHIKPTVTFEPLCLHMFCLLHVYGFYFAPQSEHGQPLPAYLPQGHIGTRLPRGRSAGLLRSWRNSRCVRTVTEWYVGGVSSCGLAQVGTGAGLVLRSSATVDLC
jgi:hypothetical protein